MPKKQKTRKRNPETDSRRKLVYMLVKYYYKESDGKSGVDEFATSATTFIDGLVKEAIAERRHRYDR